MAFENCLLLSNTGEIIKSGPAEEMVRMMNRYDSACVVRESDRALLAMPRPCDALKAIFSDNSTTNPKHHRNGFRSDAELDEINLEFDEAI